MMNEMAQVPTYLGRYAGFVTRLVAFILDRLVVSLVLLLIGASLQFILNAFQINQILFAEYVPRQIVVAAIAVTYILISIGYDVGFWLLAGQTPGKRVMGLRIVRTDGKRVGFGNALRRVLGFFVSSILFLGFMWILFDNRRQGFHDKIAGTFVVYSWPEKELQGTFVRDRVASIRYKHQQSSTGEGQS
jgi:uncharacterized RDD family membrane protein YckC